MDNRVINDRVTDKKAIDDNNDHKKDNDQNSDRDFTEELKKPGYLEKGSFLDKTWSSILVLPENIFWLYWRMLSPKRLSLIQVKNELIN